MRHPLPLRSRRGASAVELALTLPVLLVMFSGIVDFGMYFSQSMKANHSVRQAARTASGIDLDDSPADQGLLTLQDQLSSFGLPTSTATLLSVDVAADGSTVTATYQAPYVSLVGIVLSSETLQMHAEMTLTMEDLSP